MTASNIFDPRPTTYYDENGEVAAGAQAFFFLANTNSPLTVCVDQELTTPHAFPVVANSRGVFPVIYLPYQDYRVLIRSANNITIYDAPYIPNEAPPSAGGGIAVTTTQIFRTGFTMHAPCSGPIDGFVRMNGRTIGSASSGATEYAAAGAQDLFSWLWANIDDLRAGVSGGRGSNANADWTANKTIVVPSMQGRGQIGMDDMGNTAANVIQVSTTASVTNGSATITVASAAGLARKMKCVIDGINPAEIAAISGTTVTLVAAYSGSTNVSATVRASFYQDAQIPAVPGGSQTIVQTDAEVGPHIHAVTDPGHKHSDNELKNVFGSGPAYTGSTVTNQPTQTGTATTGITINSGGQGLPMQIVPPGLTGTFYIKL